MGGNRRWTKTEILVLKNEYGREDVSFLAKKLKRSIDAVHCKACQLDIEFKRTDLLDVNMRISNIEKKIELLVELVFADKKLKTHDILYIRQHYYDYSIEKISEDLHLPVFRVRNAIRKLINSGMLLKKYGGDQNLLIF